MAKWWNEDMADASQVLYGDQALALQVATMPDAVLQGPQLLDPEKIETLQNVARVEKGGFMEKMKGLFGIVSGGVDKTMSDVPGWGVAKAVSEKVGQAVWWPIDKLASGAYWLYSEAVSQPLSTYILQSGKAMVEGDPSVFFSGDEWSEAYGKAEHISPGQAAANVGAAIGSTRGWEGPVAALGFGSDLDPDVERWAEQKLYDNEYWRDKAGWGYTVGTGATDAIITIAGDPLYPVIAGTAKAVKSTRHIQVGTGAGKATPEEAVQSRNVNDFFDWAEGKSAAEIAAHPIWGKGRRKDLRAEQWGQVLSTTNRESMPLALRFAMGDNEAMKLIGIRARDMGTQIGRMSDNRIFLDSVKFDRDMLGHFIREEQLMRVSPNSSAPGGVARSDPYLNGQLVEPPYPRPINPGPRQSGWDATYGHLARESNYYRTAAGEVLKSRNATPLTMFGNVAVTDSDILRANQWKDAKLAEIDEQIRHLKTTDNTYKSMLGNSFGKSIEEFEAGSNNMFGTLKQLYRQGILPGVGSAKQGDKAVAKLGSGRGNVPEGGLATRVLRNGFYRTPVRFVQAFGEKLPAGFVNHSDPNAGQEVMNLLKQVRGMSPETRIALADEYIRQPDKVSRANALKNIHGAIIHHYGQAKGLDPAVIAEINAMTQDGVAATMMKLTGTKMTSEKFTSVAGDELQQAVGSNVDLYEDGEALIMMPHAKTQLSQGDVLLPVREFERFIDRHAGQLQAFKQGVGTAKDIAVGASDGLSKVWKASTLLRPGYTVRTVSEEAAAAAVKFGVLTQMMGSSKGGWNFLRNRGQEVMAFIGKDSYVPTTGKGAGSTFARVKIEDPAVKAIAEQHGLKTERIRVSDAWPLVESRIEAERKAITDLEKTIKKYDAKGWDSSRYHNMLDDHKNTLDEFSEYATEILRTAKDSQGRRLDDLGFEYKGVTVSGPFSGEWVNPLTRDQVSSQHALSYLFARAESIDMSRMIKTGSWVDVTPNMPNYMESWMRAVNLQMRQDDLYRLVAQDDTLKTARDWLKTPEGKNHISELGKWADEPEALLNVVKLTLDKYVPRGTGLQSKIAANEEIFEHELRAAINKDDFPTVHGEELAATTPRFSRESANHKLDQIISEGYRLLGSTPSDLLVRHPVFNQAYSARMREAIDSHQSYRRSIGGDESITPVELNKMYEKATTLAKNDIRQVVYDPQRTTATEALRFIYPFLSAHSDSLQRWAGLVAEKPTTLTGISKIYNAPVAANLVTDGEGNFVGQDGYAEVKDTEGKVIERKFVPIEDRVITFRSPSNVINMNTTGNIKGGTPIKIQAINTILPGDPWFNPGVGPFVQAPASVIAKKAPQIGDFLQWSKVLPYGPNDSVIDAFAPKYMRQAYLAFTKDDPNNEKFQQIWLDVYNMHYAQNYKSGKPVDFKAVDKEAREFMNLKVLEAWASPYQTQGTPITGTPYQFFVDQYKKLRETDPKNADAIFLATYGEQYFPFTASLSKSLGVAPTIAAMTKAEEYADLIAQDPDMASFIVGDTYNGGAFSASVYRQQMQTQVGGKPYREKTSALDAIRDNQVQLGWNAYLKYKGLLDSSLLQNGFKSYDSPGAEGYAQMRDELIANISAQYPQWQKERGEINTQKLSNRITFFEKAVQDKRLQSDPLRFDLAGLDMYLQGRRAFKAQLAARGGNELSFDSNDNPIGPNADLAYQWRMFQTSVVAGNIQFQDVFNRYLENDNLQ